jgi:hypothetical protein
MVGALCCALVACGPSALPEPEGLTSLAKVSSGELKVEMFSGSALVAGKNTVFYRVTNEGSVVDSAQLEQRPEHACPLHDPSAPNADGLWEGTLIFPSPGSAGFALDVRMKPEDAAQRLELGVLDIGDSPLAKLLTHDGQNVLIAVSFPAEPHVGKNAVEVTAHLEHGGMGYMPADDVEFRLVTQMPSMGHGASGNVSPARSENGVYRGPAVFSMAGEWMLMLSSSRTRCEALRNGTCSSAPRSPPTERSLPCVEASSLQRSFSVPSCSRLTPRRRRRSSTSRWAQPITPRS